ncbi:MAG TPA: glycoside hydrolase family 44 protein [Geothrix sp.]|nr:glycoside hydrolase family 44 protein [Geothrix sp.]
MSPLAVSLGLGGTQTFTATVTGSSNQAVAWTVEEASGGAVSAAGLYTAPSAAGTYHVKATSQADTTKHAQATVTVAAGLGAPAISYDASSYAFTTGMAIPTLHPTNAGGAAVTWSVTPALPAGLSLSASTGDISGTPTAVSPQASYTVTATNASGQGTALIGITVNAPGAMKYAQVYESGFTAPWLAATWNAVTTNPGAPMPAGHAGTAALEFSLGSWCACGFGQPYDGTANPPQLNEARTIEFDLYFAADSASPDGITFILNDAGLSDELGIAAMIPTWSTLTAAQKLGHWFHVTVDLAAIHPVNPDIRDFLLFDNSGAAGSIHAYLASARIGYLDRTTPPVVTQDSATLNPDYTQLTLAFHTDEPVVYQVDYGVGNYNQSVAGPTAYGSVNTATLTGLTPGTMVQYRIVATDHRMDPTATPNQGSLLGTFSVPAIPTAPPVISGLAVSGVTGNHAVLSWNTDRPCTAGITYQRTGGPLMTRTLSALATTSSITLDLLEPTFTYSVAVKATDAFSLNATGTLTFSAGATVTPTVTITVNPASAQPISPYIYGSNQNLGAPQYTLGRMGGDLWTTFNWTNNACNAGADWYNWNYDYIPWSLGVPADQTTLPGISLTYGLNRILGPAAGPATGAGAALITIPIQGNVAADLGTDPNDDISNTPNYLTTRLKTIQPIKGSPFTLTPSPSDLHVYTDEYVNWIKTVAKPAHPGKEIFYSLDNEPDIWFGTHAVSVPTRDSYDSFLGKEIAAAKAVKGVDAAATIFGFVSYGWYGYTQFQGSPDGSGSDFAAHGDFTEYYLDQMKAASTAAGKRLVDVLDLHYYTSATTPDGSVDVGSADVSPAVAAARVQSTRSLWDPTYVETSWITRDALPDGDKPIRLIPRMKAKIDANYPGTKLAITEYNFQGGSHISGAIAQADALGIFGQYGLFAATRWEMDSGHEAMEEAAFLLFRGFDGAGANFGDTSLMTISSDTASVSAYVSQDSAHPGRYVIVAINRSLVPKDVAFSGLPASGTAYVYRLDANADPVHPTPSAVGQVPANLATWVINLPPSSISTIEVR